jgi:hypothetical protein
MSSTEDHITLGKEAANYIKFVSFFKYMFNFTHQKR